METVIYSAEEFVALVDRQDEESREILHGATASEEVWMDIILRFPEYRRAVAFSKGLPEGVLRYLANDYDWMIRMDVASKRALPQDLFDLLSNDPHELVRKCIARNPKVPTDILEKLTLDPDLFIVQTALENIIFREEKRAAKEASQKKSQRHLPGQGVESQGKSRWVTAWEAVWLEIVLKNKEYRPIAASHKELPEGVLRNLADDPNDEIRESIARERVLPQDLYILLSNDPEELVRTAIAENANTPLEILQKMASDPKQSVARAAQSNIALMEEQDTKAGEK